MNALTWVLLTICLAELASSWLFRRRMKMQHEMMVRLYSEIATNRRNDADTWTKKSFDFSLSEKERRDAYYHAAGAFGNVHAFEEVASDIEHFLINKQPFGSRRMYQADEETKSESPKKSQAIVFSSKGGDA